MSDSELVPPADRRRKAPPDVGLTRIRILVAKRIADALVQRNLSPLDAQRLTQFDRATFYRIRLGQLERFTLDRLLTILGKLEPDFEVDIGFRRKSPMLDPLTLERDR